MRNRICGGIGVVWGGAIVGYAIFNGISQAGGGYAAGQLAGVVLGALMFIVGFYYLAKGRKPSTGQSVQAKAETSPKKSGFIRDDALDQKTATRWALVMDGLTLMVVGVSLLALTILATAAIVLASAQNAALAKNALTGPALWIIGVLLIFGGCTTYLIGVLTALAAPAPRLAGWMVGHLVSLVLCVAVNVIAVFMQYRLGRDPNVMVIAAVANMLNAFVMVAGVVCVTTYLQGVAETHGEPALARSCTGFMIFQIVLVILGAVGSWTATMFQLDERMLDLLPKDFETRLYTVAGIVGLILLCAVASYWWYLNILLGAKTAIRRALA